MRTDGISLSLRLPGFRVIAIDDGPDFIEIVVETICETACCPKCRRTDEVKAKERRMISVQDLPLRPGVPTWLTWRKRRLVCRRCKKSFSETHDAIPSGGWVTSRFADHLARRVAQGDPVARVARDERVSFYRAQRSFTDYALRRRKGRRLNPTILAVDEAAQLKGCRYNTTISDPGVPRVLDVVEGRKRAGLERWLRRLPGRVKAQVRAVAIDLWDPYRQAVRAALPAARVVADKFHVIRQATGGVEAVRRFIQGQVARGRKAELFRARHRLLKGTGKLTLADLDHLVPLLARYPQLLAAWELLWGLRQVYAAPTPEEAERKLDIWIAEAAANEFAPFRKAAATFLEWRQEILAYFTTGVTNAYSEGVTNKIKVLKRSAYGIPNFRNYRDRVLAACG